MKTKLAPEEIREIVRHMTDANLSVNQAAKNMGTSWQTLNRRLEQVIEQTGYDPRLFWQAYFLTVKCHDLRQLEKEMKRREKKRNEA